MTGDETNSSDKSSAATGPTAGSDALGIVL